VVELDAFMTKDQREEQRMIKGTGRDREEEEGGGGKGRG